MSNRGYTSKEQALENMATLTTDELYAYLDKIKLEVQFILNDEHVQMSRQHFNSLYEMQKLIKDAYAGTKPTRY